MRRAIRSVVKPSAVLGAGILMWGLPAGVTGQHPPAQAPPATATAQTAAPAGPPANPNAAATAVDHKNMLEQLGIPALRPGPSGNEAAPTHANSDEALANPYPKLPDPLTLENGQKVTS